jgi:DNA-binding response OmpR family regulator
VSQKRKAIILVVDDEPDARMFLMNLLNSEGFSSITAADTTDGIKKAMAVDPSVIILNMMMPNEGGIYMYRNLKRHKKLKRIPVIMLSTIDKDTFLKCQNIYGFYECVEHKRVDTFMEKPPEADELLAMVRELSAQKFQATSV